MLIKKKEYQEILERMNSAERNEEWARGKIAELRREVKWYRTKYPNPICELSLDPVKHIYNARNYCYALKNQNGYFSVCEDNVIKKGSIVKVYDSDTGELLETERGDFIFELGADYSGESRIPFFK